MSSAGQCGHVHLNGRSVLNERTRKVVLRIRRCEGLLLATAPMHLERVDDSRNWMSHRMAGIEAVGKRERVEHAEISKPQCGLSIVKIHVDAGVGYWYGPKHSCARDTDVVRVWARRAQTVDSNEGEATSTLLAISSQVRPRHKATIGVETIRLTCTCI